MSSFYEDASLVVIPSGYKTSKIYAEKPTDGSGDLTFTRASGATRVASNGLIEKVRTNLNLYSNDFSNAAWSKLSNASVSGTRVADPFGGNTAWQFIFDGTANGRIEQTISGAVANGEYTFSVWLRVASGTQSVIIASRGTETTVTVTTTWQRFTSTSAAASTDAYPRVRCDSAVTIQAYGAQTEIGDIATDYIPTTTAAVSVGPVSNVPRLDYLGSTCPRLNLEPQRTNSFNYSEQFDNAYWVKVTATVTANNVASPDGSTNADKVEFSSGYFSGTTTVTANQTYTVSFFAKKGTANLFQISEAFYVGTTVAFDLNTGTVTSGTGRIENYGNGWYRCSMQFTYGVGQTIASWLVRNYQAGYIYLWGAQLEAGAYATSYIPTLGASVTRVADAASKTGISSLIGQTEGVIFLDFVASAQNQDGAGYAALTIFGTSTDNIQLYNIDTTLYWYARNTAGLLIDQAANETLVAGQRYKIAYAYKSGDYVLYINGVQKRTYTGSAVPAVSQFNLCGTGFGVSAAGVKNEFSQMLLFKTRLTNAQLAELTTL